MATVEFGKSVFGTSNLRMMYGRRVWTARIDLMEEVGIDVGTSVTVTIDETAFSGVVVKNASTLGKASIVVVGGAGALRLTVSPTSLRNASGVRLTSAMTHLFASTNEAGRKAGLSTVETLNVNADRVLGKAWAAMSGTSVSIIDASFSGKWYVDRFGVTRIGYATPANVDASLLTVQAPRPTDGMVTIAPNEVSHLSTVVDSIGAQIVGYPLEAPITIGCVSIEETDVLRVHISS